MLKKMAVGPLQANCYILGCNDTKEGIVIDPGGDALDIAKEITKEGLRITRVVLTHGHFDHTGGVVELRDITKAPVFIHVEDEPLLNFVPDGHLEDSQVFNVGEYKVSIIHTPGHSPGGICFFAPGAVFCFSGPGAGVGMAASWRSEDIFRSTSAGIDSRADAHRHAAGNRRNHQFGGCAGPGFLSPFTARVSS